MLDDIKPFTSRLRAGMSHFMEQEMWRLLLLMDRATVQPWSTGLLVWTYLAILKLTGGLWVGERLDESSRLYEKRLRIKSNQSKHLLSKPCDLVDVLVENQIVLKMKWSINELLLKLCLNLLVETSLKTLIYCFIATSVFVSYLIILRDFKT